MLDAVWRKVDDCAYCKENQNELQHVHGGGKQSYPDLALVFINPTYNNVSTRPSWNGARFPFVGTRPVWRVFVKSGLLPEQVLNLTEGNWSVETALAVQETLRRNGLYLTNVVKCTASHGNSPPAAQITEGKKLLFEELAIVKPRLIVAMGLIPFKTLTGNDVKLGEFSQEFPKRPKSFCSEFGTVVPCWFPVGRGNPKKAVELLSLIKSRAF